MKRIIIILLILGFGLTQASFYPFKNTLYFQNKQTKEIKYFETRNYSITKLKDTYLLSYLDETSIGDESLFKNWVIIGYCSKVDEGGKEEKCHSSGTIKVGSFSLSVQDFDSYEEDIEKIKLYKSSTRKFTIEDLTKSERQNYIYFKILKDLSIEFLIFLPLNLLIFSCFGYLSYIIFRNKLKIKHPYLFVYFISFLFYLITFSLLFYVGWATKYSWLILGFMSYIFFIGPWKIILFLTSIHVMEKMRKKHEKKFSFGTFVTLFYVVIFVGIVFVIPMFKRMMN